MQRGKLLLLVGFWLLSLQGSAQDPHFTQFYANAMYLNPAFAGVSRCPRVNLQYRNQFPTLGVYQTYFASYDQYVQGIKGGLGFMVLRDEAGKGALNLTEVSAVYSYHLAVSRKFTLLAGFQATFRQRQLDWNSLTFPDQIDQFYGFVKPSNEVPPVNNVENNLDISAGLLGYTKNFFFGLAMHHLTQPDEAFLIENRLPLKITAHAGASIPLGPKRLHNSTRTVLIPNLLYQQQGTFTNLTYAISFNRKSITGGLGFRHSFNNPDALLILLGYSPEDSSWGIGYSYDYTISQFSNVGGGAHELSLKYNFPCRVRKKRVAEVKCPKF
jgi:type IX secretion system PorP/SprF family membrane protein